MEKEVQELRQIEPYTLIFDILRNLWVIVLGAAAAGLLAYVAVSVTYVPQYSTSATFAVSTRSDSNAATNLAAANEMAQTFQKIMKSSVMNKMLCETLQTEKLDADISTEVIPETNLLILRVTGDSPREAYDLIRAIMENYTKVSYYSVGDAVMDVLQEPGIPLSPDNPLDERNAVKKGVLLGAAFFAVLFAFLSYMSDTVKQEDEVERKLDAKNLGAIPYEKKYKTLREKLRRGKDALLINNPLAGFPFVESYRKLATKVDYQMSRDERKVLVVTSVSENEGKSTVAANLAIALANQSKRVLLMEGDLRRPSQFLIFGKQPDEENEIGEVLKGQGRAKAVLQKSGIPNLYLMLGRNCYSSSTEILQSGVLERLLNSCRHSMDYVIIDSPPAGLMGDAEVLAKYADAVLMVVKQNYMRSEDINDVLDSFREHHSKVLGVVLNSIRSFSAVLPGNYYGGYSYYGKYGNYGKNRED